MGLGIEGSGARPMRWYAGVLASALAGGVIGALFLPFLYLFARETLFWFLSLGLIALLAALGAVWAGNALAVDGTKSRLLSVVGASEAAAALIAVGNLILLDTASDHLISQLTPFARITASTVMMALVAAAMTLRLRSREADAVHISSRDPRIAVILLVLAALVVIGAVVLDAFLSPNP